MDLERIRKLKGKLACEIAAVGADAAGAAGAPPALHTAVKRLSLDDPIYISSPSHEAIGRALAIDDTEISPSGSNASQKKRWAKVRGAFGALGKFRRKGNTESRPSPGAPGVPGHEVANAAGAASPASAADIRSAVVEQSSALPEAPKSAAPRAPGAAAGVEESLLHTSAIHPNLITSLPYPAEPAGEETLSEETAPEAAAFAEKHERPWFAPSPVHSPRPECTAAAQNSAEPPSTVPQVAGPAGTAADIAGARYSPHCVGTEVSAERPAQHYPAAKGPVPANLLAVRELIPTGLWGCRIETRETARKPGQRFAASRYADLSSEPNTVKENAISMLATELEKREIARRRKKAADAIIAELLRLEMEASICLELDNLERQRSRIQASEEEEEERWRRIQEYHLHASTPLHLQSERQASLKGVLEAEARERAWRMSEDGIQSMSGRSKYADDSRKAINAEFCKIVWPGVESCAPAGEHEVALPPGQSRRNPAAVLYFCLSQRNFRKSRAQLVTIGRGVRQDPVPEMAVQATHQPKPAEINPSSKCKSTWPSFSCAQIEMLRTVQFLPPAPPDPIKEPTAEAMQNAPLGWLDSIKATVTHIAEDTVEGFSHLAEQAATKSSDVATATVPRLSLMPSMPALNLSQLSFEIPGASLLSPKTSGEVDPAKRLDFA